MKEHKVFILILFLTFNIFQSLSQDDGPKVVVFNSEEQDEKRDEIYARNLFKFGLLSPFAGDFSFYYERVLAKSFSMEVGLGITIEDYIQGFINDDIFSVSSENNLFGPSALIGFRYYPVYTPEEFYIAGEFKYKQYRSQQIFNSSDDIFSRSTNVSKFRLTFGYQFFVYDNVFWDFFGGFGLGSETIVNYTEEFADPSSPTNNDMIIVKNENRELKPYVHIGVKIGLTFDQNN